MKKIIIVLAILLFTFNNYAQNGFNYKAIIKDDLGNIIANDLIIVQFQILQGTGMTNVYQETHTPNTDVNGIIIINIGEGPIVNNGVFTDIDWGSDDHFLNVQIDTGGGLTDMGTTQFMAVPYALSTAKESVKIDDLSDGKSDNDGTEDGSSIFLGVNAGASDTATDNRNIGIGAGTLQNNVFGINNVAIGFESLSNSIGTSGVIVSGDGNTAIGAKSLSLSTQGYFNVAVGTNAMRENEDGSRNVAVGSGSLLSNTIGINNTATGFGVLSTNISGNGNIAYGWNALKYNNADNNVAIGYFAAQWNKANSQFTALGYEAMRYANDGLTTVLVNNTAIGYQALRGSNDPSNNIGVNNTALGHQVLRNNAAGNGNVGIGTNALLNNIGISGFNTSGDDNVAIGYESMKDNTQGYFNVAIGKSSVELNVDGTRNVGIGAFALFSNIGGDNNSALGFNSLASNDNGNHNVAFGSNALQKNKGDQNVGLGAFSLWSSETSTGNVALGYKAGYSELGSNKLYIHNENADAENSLIYGEFDQALISLNADVSIKNSLNVSAAGITFTDNKTINKTLSIKYIISTSFSAFTTDVGEIKLYAGAIIPANHLACNGASYIRTDYQDLYDVIGTTYGEGDNPGTTFNVPDLRNSVPIHQE